MDWTKLTDAGLTGICIALILYAAYLSRMHHELQQRMLTTLKENADKMASLAAMTERLVHAVEELVSRNVELCAAIRGMRTRETRGGETRKPP